MILGQAAVMDSRRKMLNKGFRREQVGSGSACSEVDGKGRRRGEEVLVVLVVIPSLRLYILLILCSISVVRSGQIRFILSVNRLKGANGSGKWSG